jgi:hypothetical protein
MSIKTHDKSICKWSEQVDGMCPYAELLNMLVNSAGKKKIRCEKKQCLAVAKKMGVNSEAELLRLTGNTNMLKPSGPAHSTSLLNQFNIEDVMSDFSHSSIKEGTPFKNGPFYNIKFEMRDFEKSLVSELRDADYKKLMENGFRTFGCVLNTDYWAGPGKHWVCIFGEMNLEDQTVKVEYFNSSGNGLNKFPELYKWAISKKFEIEDVVHETLQYSDTECGMWCLCYIKSRLEGHPKDYFHKHNIRDEFVTKMRRYIFTG